MNSRKKNKMPKLNKKKKGKEGSTQRIRKRNWKNIRELNRRMN